MKVRGLPVGGVLSFKFADANGGDEGDQGDVPLACALVRVRLGWCFQRLDRLRSAFDPGLPD